MRMENNRIDIYVADFMSRSFMLASQSLCGQDREELRLAFTDGWGELDGPPGFIAAKLSPEERRERERELLQASIKAEQDGVVLTIPSETKEQGIIRIVLGELTEQESNEWIARFSNRLRV